MAIYITCAVCNHEFEDEDTNDKDDGNCPKCNAHYVICYDCADDIDAILIADFDINHT